MYQLFYKYLILNQKVSIPGLGSFFIDNTPSRMDFIHKKITPPETVIAFNDDAVGSDRKFVDYLKKELNLPDTDVLKSINDFAHHIRNGAEAGGISLPGIGKMQTGYENNLFFSPERKTDALFQTIDLENPAYTHAKFVDVYDYSGDTERMIKQEHVPVNEAEKVHHEIKEDYWWVYAIVLAIMGMAALFYYYI